MEMTKELLFLDFTKADEGETGPPSVRLATRSYSSDERGLISLTRTCDTLEQFEQAVQELKESMDILVEQARETFEQYQSQVETSTMVMASESPQEVWKVMEACASIQEMREIFNNLGLQKRQELADYVLTQLNIFKGAASIFSQHYNEEEYVLE